MANNELLILFQGIAQRFGEETGKYVREEIEKILSLEQVDVEELSKRIETISKVLDGDTDDEYSVENIIKIISDNSAAINKVKDQLLALTNKVNDIENQVNILNSDETVEGSVSNKIKAAVDPINDKISNLEATINDQEDNISEIESIANEALSTAQTALNRSGLVGSKDVDESNIGNERILVYDSESGKLVYKDLPKVNVIDDTTISSDKTYSSEKIENIRNDLQAQINERTKIDDEVASDTTTYSSNKIEEKLTNLKDNIELEISNVENEIQSLKNEHENDIQAINDELANTIKVSDVTAISLDNLVNIFSKALRDESTDDTNTDSSDTSSDTSGDL